MTLKEKLVKIYEAIDHIEKKGHNKAQGYFYIRSADVTHAIRKQLAELKVYAEINFEFIGDSYTIARAKDKDAPFSAVNVRCSIIFRDLESDEILSASGLGSGADGGDKAAYKAQTGALKYALKNAFLVPDEADPEADESVDENSIPETRGQHGYAEEPPDFRGAQHAAPRPNTASDRRPAAAAAPRPTDPARAYIPSVPAEAGSSQPALSTATPPSSGVDVAAAPLPTMTNVQVAGREPGDEDEIIPAVTPKGFAKELDIEEQSQTFVQLPTEEELTLYRTKFSKLGDDLSTKGKLKSSKGLPINRKLLVFLLNITKATEAKNITTAQWEDFFQRVEKALTLEDGPIGLATLVNKANGIEEKK